MKYISILIVLVFIAGCTATTPKGATQTAKQERYRSERSQKPPYQEVSDAFYESLNRMIGYKSSQPVATADALRHIRPKAPEKSPKISSAAIAETSAKPDRLAKEHYQAAYRLYRIQRYDASKAQFRAFLNAFPQNDLSDNAWYWIGECHYARAEYEPAIEAFQTVIHHYKGGNKRPDAMLKTGMCLLQTGDRKASSRLLMQVSTDYPKNRVAGIAKRLLKTHSL